MVKFMFSWFVMFFLVIAKVKSSCNNFFSVSSGIFSGVSLALNVVA